MRDTSTNMTNILKPIIPNPGTKEAIEAGCKCPVIDNNYGKGYYGVAGEFAYNMDCKLHTMPMSELKKMMGIKG